MLGVAVGVDWARPRAVLSRGSGYSDYFRMHKFQTMVANAEKLQSQRRLQAPPSRSERTQLTPIGRLLRGAGWNELQQLLARCDG